MLFSSLSSVQILISRHDKSKNLPHLSSFCKGGWARKKEQRERVCVRRSDSFQSEAGDTVSSLTDQNTILLPRRILLWSRSGAASVKDPEQTHSLSVFMDKFYSSSFHPCCWRWNEKEKIPGVTFIYCCRSVQPWAPQPEPHGRYWNTSYGPGGARQNVNLHFARSPARWHLMSASEASRQESQNVENKCRPNV